MADSRRELALQDVIAALSGAGKPAELTVHRFRLRPLNADLLPAVAVYLLNEQRTRPTTRFSTLEKGVILIGLQFRVESETPDVTLDPYLVWAEQALVAAPLPGGTADDVQLRSIDWGGEARDKQYGIALMQFALQVDTKVGDPTTL